MLCAIALYFDRSDCRLDEGEDKLLLAELDATPGTPEVLRRSIVGLIKPNCQVQWDWSDLDFEQSTVCDLRVAVGQNGPTVLVTVSSNLKQLAAGILE